MTNTTLPDILLIDKPVGITSFDVIRQLRRQTGFKKFGHAGTLDPLASGLMVLGVGAGTKKLAEYIKLDKEYEAEILLGQRRTTGDMEGVVTEEKVVEEERWADIFSNENVSAQLTNLVGELTLPVSAYSAIKRDGVPMYKRARAAAARGEEVGEVPVRVMCVYEAELLSISTRMVDDKVFPILSVRFLVGSGTYIRSLAEELGRLLGCPACLAALRRTRVGEFRIEEALQLSDIKNEPAAN